MKSVTKNSPDFNILVSAHTGAFFSLSLSFRFQSGWKLSYVCWPAGKISREGGAVGMISTARRSRSLSLGPTGDFQQAVGQIRLLNCATQWGRERDMCSVFLYGSASFLRGNFGSYGAPSRSLFSDHPHNFPLANSP